MQNKRIQDSIDKEARQIMAQVLPRYCPRCGTPTVAGQRFCANCGLSSEEMQLRTSQTQQQARQTPPYSPQGKQTRDFSSPPSSRSRSFGRTGCILILLASLMLLGTGSYIGVVLLGVHLPGLNSGGAQPPITTMPINAMVMYRGVDITVVNAQQAQSFVDDPNTSGDGMVRLNLQEQNKTNVQVSWSYEEAARLLLPGRAVVAPAYIKAKSGIAPGATQTGILDFAVPTSDKIGKLTLRLGSSDEAQIAIPLTGKADLGRYQPRTTRLNGQMQYFGLNWTLSSAVSSLSIPGQQATAGMRYLVLTLRVDNTLSQEAISGSAYDYVRLKFGNSTASPKSTTLPVSFASGEAGKTGTVTFLVPQNRTAFSLELLSQTHNPNDQASTDFQAQ